VAAVLAAAAIAAAAVAVAVGQERGAASGGAGAAQAPVQITSEEAEYLSAEHRVIFTGKVVAVQEDATITADRMEVRLQPPETAEGEEPPKGGILAADTSGTRLESILATGNVTFRQAAAEGGNERYATGERGEYDAVRRVVTLSGGAPRAWEGQNVVSCEKMVFSLEENTMTCSGKVNMKVYPSEGREGGAAAPPAPAAPAGPAGAP